MTPSRVDPHPARRQEHDAWRSRLGADAALSLGNKKAVDITVVRSEVDVVRLDVKGVAGAHDWPADNVCVSDRHFIVLVSFEGRIDDVGQLPSVWVVPSQKLEPLLRRYSTRTVVSRGAVRAEGAHFRDAWQLVLGSDPVS